MDPTVIEKDGNLVCVRHKKKVIQLIIQDNSIPFSETFLCSKCMDEKPTISKVIGLAQAKAMISERYTNLDGDQENHKQKTLKNLQIFYQKMMDARSQFIQTMDEVLGITQLWITELGNIGKRPEQINLILELEQLYLNNIAKQSENDIFENTKKSYLMKFDLAFQKLLSFNEFQQCSDYLKSMEQQQSEIDKQQQVINLNNKIKILPRQPSNVNQLNPITYKLINSVKESEAANTIVFNSSGSIMVSGCQEDIKIWKFDKGSLAELRKLEGHLKTVTCLVFSKKLNWFFSGSNDNSIRCWKEQANHDWLSSQPQQQHQDCVMRLILNSEENELISCSQDKTIKVWKMNYQLNKLQFDYVLENKHSGVVFCISLNLSESALVSCSYDKQIILWMKGQNKKWEYKNHIINDDFGLRICFISDDQIAWQQWNAGFTHIYEIENRILKEKLDLKIKLNKTDYDQWFFPTIFNQKKQILIQKHDKYVYILRKQNNGQFKIESDPIDCSNQYNYGTLTEDGEYLAIWSEGTKEFRIYKILDG